MATIPHNLRPKTALPPGEFGLLKDKVTMTKTVRSDNRELPPDFLSTKERELALFLFRF